MELRQIATANTLRRPFSFWVIAIVTCFATVANAQVSGNQVYEKETRYNSHPSETVGLHNTLNDSTFIVSARVLMNVKADEFVAIFGLAEVAENVQQCGERMEARLSGFMHDIHELGVAKDDMFVDIITQNPAFDYQFSGSLATEQQVGFEMKKNISIHYKKHELIDALLKTAASHGIFDLVKVDYIVKDPTAIYDQLVDKASDVLDKKRDTYLKLSGCKLKAGGQIFTDERRMIAPKDNYRSYQAYESSRIYSSYSQGITTKDMRKSYTYYFGGAETGSYDLVMNPIILEPTVQFELTLAIKYDRIKG